jgi:hypothetical protein
MVEPSVIAIDWSGRNSLDQIHHIRAAQIDRDGQVELWCDLTRHDVVDELVHLTDDVVVGFDFSFGFPAWVGQLLGARDGTDVWELVARDGEEWLRSSPAPFFGPKGKQRPAGVDLLRDTERRHGAKSTFQIAGAGAVGTGALRGMPLLAELRDAGYAVWPFDAPRRRTVVEIYPRVFLARARTDILPPRVEKAVRNSEDTRDAVYSALAMWDARHSFEHLTAGCDAQTLLEGEIWHPAFGATASP